MNRDHDIVHQLDRAEDALRRQRLKTMQRVAFALLLGAGLLFALARSHHGEHPGWGYLEAFAEAAMVGAIADWFAVVALFRHPLGIPVWHTAIIPNSKDSIGTSLGNFVENHFVTEEGIVERVRQADLAARLGEWLIHPTHAAQVAQSGAALLRQVLQHVDDESIARMVREVGTAELLKLDIAAIAGGGLDAFVAAGKPQQLLDAVLDKTGSWLADDANHDAIGAFLLRCLNIENPMMQMGLRTYLPSAIVSLQGQIEDLRRTPDHPLRTKLAHWIADGTLHLKADPSWHAAVRDYQQQTVHSEAVQSALSGLWGKLRQKLLAGLEGDAPALLGAGTGLVEKVGRVLVSEPGARAWINTAIESISRTLVQRHRSEVTPFIEQQLAKWTKEEMSERIELAIGRDLQFIRINGTIVGGLAGVAIHAVLAYF